MPIHGKKMDKSMSDTKMHEEMHGKDMNAMKRGDMCPVHDMASVFYDEGTSPGLGKDFGKKDDSDLTSGYVPSVRKTGPLG